MLFLIQIRLGAALRPRHATSTRLRQGLLIWQARGVEAIAYRCGTPRRYEVAAGLLIVE